MILSHAIGKIINIISAVKKLSVTWLHFSVYNVARLDQRNICNTGKDSFSVFVPKTTLYPILCKKTAVNGIVLNTDILILLCKIAHHFFKIILHNITFPFKKHPRVTKPSSTYADAFPHSLTASLPIYSGESSGPPSVQSVTPLH